jgi:hypothetical protein
MHTDDTPDPEVPEDGEQPVVCGSRCRVVGRLSGRVDERFDAEFTERHTDEKPSRHPHSYKTTGRGRRQHTVALS